MARGPLGVLQVLLQHCGVRAWPTVTPWEGVCLHGVCGLVQPPHVVALLWMLCLLEGFAATLQVVARSSPAEGSRGLVEVAWFEEDPGLKNQTLLSQKLIVGAY